VEDLARDTVERGAGEKSNGSCPVIVGQSCREREVFLLVGMALTYFKEDRVVWFRAHS
jgi:hypothetical protein